MKRILALILTPCLMLPMASSSQEPPLLYHVELILFRQLDGVAEDAWPSSRRTQVPRNARALAPADADEPPPANFHRAAVSDRVLARSWRRLGELGDVAPVLHLAWRQSHGLLRSGRRVRLDDEIDGLTGFIALRLGNRLVAEIDMTLDASRATDEVASTSWHDDGRADREEPGLSGTESTEAETETLGFRLHQRRTIRLGENHYFDHPAFGIILRVQRVEPATPAP